MKLTFLIAIVLVMTNGAVSANCGDWTIVAGYCRDSGASCNPQNTDACDPEDMCIPEFECTSSIGRSFAFLAAGPVLDISGNVIFSEERVGEGFVIVQRVGTTDRVLANSSLLIGTASLSYSEEQGELLVSYELGGLETWLKLSGFPTRSEIEMTFLPETTLGSKRGSSADTLAFRVPLSPEYLPAVDSFDAYVGDLAHVGDWSQAQPLQCSFPATPPAVGEFVKFEDPMGDPAPGTGRYYVTAVRHQDEVRYGRRTTNGQLSGRDPALLPPCE